MATLIPVTGITLNPNITQNALMYNTEVELPVVIAPSTASKKIIVWSVLAGAATFRTDTTSGKHYMTPKATGTVKILAKIEGGKLITG